MPLAEQTIKIFGHAPLGIALKNAARPSGSA
jgi:hypothetical protein